MISPVVLFVFARPDHTLQTLNALAANDLADQSDLIVYADGPRNESDVDQVKAVRDVVRAATGFRSVTLIARETNFGLARNIIEGVTEVCDRYGRVIVLEDDIVTAPSFLRFINGALDRYADDPRVWHVSGWNYPIDANGLGDAYFWQMMNCWGWATWADRWRYFSTAKDEVSGMSVQDRRRFNIEGTFDFWSHLELNWAGKMHTWAIFWYATIFTNGGLALNPAVSLTNNIGYDGSGTNCLASDVYQVTITRKSVFEYPDQVTQNMLARKRIRGFYRRSRPPFYKRGLSFLKRKMFGK